MNVVGSVRDARTLLFSPRNLERAPWLSLQYEFEDVICEVDSVELVRPTPPAISYSAQVRHGLYNQARRRMRRRVRHPIDAVAITGSYDLFFMIAYFGPDLAYLERLRGWRERCRKAVCFLAEVWSPELASKVEYLEILAQFDHVLVMSEPVSRPLSKLIGRPVEFMPHATDALRFCPYPSPPPRVIDLYALGRRAPVTHGAALEWAERTGAFYVFDTTDVTTGAAVFDHREHRAHIASYVKRSKYFLAYSLNPARLDRTGGDEAISTRYFEGAAGGAVMVGTTPKCAEWDQNFDWPDAVIEIPYDTSDIGEILAELDGDPERLEEARRNNVMNSLRRHDWVHRWEQVLRAGGLDPLPALDERLARLEEQAADVSRLAVGAVPSGAMGRASQRSAAGGAA